MRVLACILVLITLVVGAFVGYCYYGAQMQIDGVAASLTPAAEAIGTYNDVRDKLANGTFIGTKYADAEFLMPESFAFLTLTVRMTNKGMFPMDWIELEVTPDVADILMLPAERTPSLAGSSSGDFSAILLTRTGVNTKRQVTVHYYVLGRAYTETFDMETGKQL